MIQHCLTLYTMLSIKLPQKKEYFFNEKLSVSSPEDGLELKSRAI